MDKQDKQDFNKGEGTFLSPAKSLIVIVIVILIEYDSRKARKGALRKKL